MYIPLYCNRLDNVDVIKFVAVRIHGWEIASYCIFIWPFWWQWLSGVPLPSARGKLVVIQLWVERKFSKINTWLRPLPATSVSYLGAAKREYTNHEEWVIQEKNCSKNIRNSILMLNCSQETPIIW